MRTYCSYAKESEHIDALRDLFQYLAGANFVDESLNARFFRDEDTSDSADKLLTRAQKKNARKKQKKKEKKTTEVAFEIEEMTTGFEELSVRKDDDLNEKVHFIIFCMCFLHGLCTGGSNSHFDYCTQA